MPKQTIYDAIVVGSGATGGWAAKELAELNKFNQSWDVKNLFVTDGSCFVSQGCQNPTLTMMAITVRASDYIAEELRRDNL